ncbi:uncharacterized protein SRS1_16774 [Sporisorium reilianum f. sp. reilianum]|uniref:Protein PBN1 n=1 Tax=Sporisorium reilianum f. sp. reilianum TaxID=72559 RepID=A0A2N8UNS9_9BASI|nr:uncharacterized protein SRS1_16774 [Sporisorium reilianum f. sp. reilianum]
MTTHNMGTLQTRLVNAHSFHPTLALTLSPAIPPSVSKECSANLLLHLPSGVFYDPYTASNDVIGVKAGRARRGTVLMEGKAELEAAVGWMARAKGAKGERRQWWERAGEEAEAEGLDMQGILAAALRRKAEEVAGVGEAVKVSLDKGSRVQVRPPTGAKQGKAEDKRERSSVVVPIQIDDLLNANGAFSLDVPLHVRYHPPTSASVDTTSALSSLSSLLFDILPTPALNLYHTLRTDLGLPAPPPTPHRNPYAQLTLAPPTLYVSCPSSAPSTKASKLFPKSHAHLATHIDTATNVVAHSTAPGALRLRVPVPDESALAPVQLTTVVTVVGAALAVVFHLVVNVLPVLEGVEKSW